MKTDERINNHSFSVSNLDKLLWPNEKYTKGDLIKYYIEIAPYILDHLSNRPIVLTRFPDGITGKYFYQKNAPPYLPEWIKTFPWYSKESDRTINFILIENAPTLAWLANQACIEIHPWLSPKNLIAYPDYVVFDLDPSETGSYQKVIDIALVLQKIFNELKLRSYLKTSGSDGLHIYLPIINKYSYKDIRDFARIISTMVCNILPQIATVERSVQKRGTKVYIDYLQNVMGKTLCSVYSVRPLKNAPVSTPISWAEITEVCPTDFTIKTIVSRVENLGDLFAPVLTDKQSIDQALSQLGLVK
jgi:bifunctional non-homologous end joining protein LigD